MQYINSIEREHNNTIEKFKKAELFIGKVAKWSIIIYNIISITIFFLAIYNIEDSYDVLINIFGVIFESDDAFIIVLLFFVADILIQMLLQLFFWFIKLFLNAKISELNNNFHTVMLLKDISKRLEEKTYIPNEHPYSDDGKNGPERVDEAPGTKKPQKINRPPSPKWRCSCGAMIDKYPCENCGYIEKANPLPVKMYQNADGDLLCPTCRNYQNENETSCKICGQVFITAKSNTPYWCGKCGHPGPFENECPKCKSTLKKYNA